MSEELCVIGGQETIGRGLYWNEEAEPGEMARVDCPQHLASVLTTLLLGRMERRSGYGVHACSPSPQDVEDHSGHKASLGYMLSRRPARATQQETVSTATKINLRGFLPLFHFNRLFCEKRTESYTFLLRADQFSC